MSERATHISWFWVKVTGLVLVTLSMAMCGGAEPPVEDVIVESSVVEPDVSTRLLQGQDPRQTVRPIKTGIGLVDRMAIMEVTWYTRQLQRMGRGRQPRPRESGLKAFVCSAVSSASGIRATRKLRSNT